MVAVSQYSLAGCRPTTAGLIVGTVTDPTGAVLPDTQVVLTNVKTGEIRQTATNQAGLYRFVDVPSGSYRITVEKKGFSKLLREPIELQVATTAQVDLAMQVGSETQNVVVTTGTPLIQAETTSLGAVIDQRETNEIPLNGRNPMNLTALVPSVVPQGGAMGTPTGTNIFAWGNYQIGGGMANQSATYLDGSPLNATYNNLMALVPTQDSLEQFKVATNNISPDMAIWREAQSTSQPNLGQTTFTEACGSFCAIEYLTRIPFTVTAPGCRRRLLRRINMVSTSVVR